MIPAQTTSAKRRGRKPKEGVSVKSKKNTTTEIKDTGSILVSIFLKEYPDFLWAEDKIYKYIENIRANYIVQSLEIFSIEFTEGVVRVVYDIQTQDLHFQREIKIDPISQGIPFATTLYFE